MTEDRQRSLAEWSLDLEERYCENRLEPGEHDAAREALRHRLSNPEVEGMRVTRDEETGDIRVDFDGIYVGDIWAPNDLDRDGWSNYPAPIIRVDDETSITAGYSFDGEGDEGQRQAMRWFIDRLRKIERGEWRRGDGR